MSRRIYLFDHPSQGTHQYVLLFRDYRELARAAVEGDQAALDLLAMKTNRPAPNETAVFFVGTDKGNVYVVTDKLRKICSVDDGVARLLHSYEHDILIVITNGNMMTQYNVHQIQAQTEILTPTHSVSETENVKRCQNVFLLGKIIGSTD